MQIDTATLYKLTLEKLFKAEEESLINHALYLQVKNENEELKEKINKLESEK